MRPLLVWLAEKSSAKVCHNRIIFIAQLRAGRSQLQHSPPRMQPSNRRRILAYVGTNTKPVDGASKGKGIYLFEMDSATGELSFIKLVAETVSPTRTTFHPSGRYLYATNEVFRF
jgi:hypothetical protein